MQSQEDHPKSPQTINGDDNALRYLTQAIMEGKHWFIAALEAIGLWASTEEYYNDRTYTYLVEGEAFDWLLLAERLCEEVQDLIPPEEREALVFRGRPPLMLSVNEVRELIGPSKYRQYLNYFYGITVESALLLAVQEEIDKERRVSGYTRRVDSADEAYRRIYGADRMELLKSFRQGRGKSRARSISLTEMKAFTYWLFKYRLKQCDKARVASDTQKALSYLKQQWDRKGLFGALVVDEPAGPF